MKKSYKHFLISTAEEYGISEENLSKVEDFLSKEDIWCKAQIHLLDTILNEFDSDIEDLFNHKEQVVNGKAQLVVYISSLKSFFKHKKLLLSKKLKKLHKF